MTSGQTFAALWGPFAIVFGTCFIVFREWISARARTRRERQGLTVTPDTQSPTLMAVAGGFLVLAGIGVLVGGLTGVIR